MCWYFLMYDMVGGADAGLDGSGDTMVVISVGEGKERDDVVMMC